MYTSRHNVFLETPHEHTVVFNALWGSMDILDKREYEVYKKIERDGDCFEHENIVAAFLEAGYISRNETVENAKFTTEYQKYIQHMASMPENFFIIPSYDCNLSCIYCFQEDVDKIHDVMKEEVIEEVFHVIEILRNERGNRGIPQITIYGGEPLLDNENQIHAVKKILQESQARNFKKIIVTNGVNLNKFISLLKDNHVDEVHVTLDGCKSVHDARRKMKNGKGTFEKIIKGIESALSEEIPIHLRIIVDRNNLEALPDLIRFLEDKTWLDNPFFRMHVGRIYECGAVSTSPYKEKNYITLVELLQYWAANASRLRGVDFGFRGIKKALFDGKIPTPLFSYCPSCTNEFVFDLMGDIYPCPGGCGDPSLKVGTFYPSMKYNDSFHKWRARNVLRIEKCQHCQFALVCGGGCPLENLAEGKDIFEPFCTPIKEEMQIGVNILYPQLLQVNDRIPRENICCQPPQKSNSCCKDADDPKKESIMKEKEEPKCNCGQIKIIPLEEEEE